MSGTKIGALQQHRLVTGRKTPIVLTRRKGESEVKVFQSIMSVFCVSECVCVCVWCASQSGMVMTLMTVYTVVNVTRGLGGSVEAVSVCAVIDSAVIASG